MWKKIKYWLWKLDLWPESNQCPYCGKKLLQHGYVPDERWTCQDGRVIRDCKFKDGGEKVKL